MVVSRSTTHFPGDLERQIEAFIEHYNQRRTLHSHGHG